MAKYYFYASDELQEIDMLAKDLPAFKASNPHLTVLRASDLDPQVIADMYTTRNAKAMRDLRRREYANGDYIDAIMKQLNYDRLEGKPLVQEMDDAIAHWLKVKQDFPI